MTFDSEWSLTTSGTATNMFTGNTWTTSTGMSINVDTTVSPEVHDYKVYGEIQSIKCWQDEETEEYFVNVKVSGGGEYTLTIPSDEVLTLSPIPIPTWEFTTTGSDPSTWTEWDNTDIPIEGGCEFDLDGTLME